MEYVRITGDGVNFVAQRKYFNEEYYEGYAISYITEKELTLKEIADYLDADAENENYHSLAAAHTHILRMLESAQVPAENIQKFMLDLLGVGGLHNL